tara:strand:- start:961 stop:1533 length:573 start_codon:yes stop_codon:yes gene_type:complete
MSFVFRSTDLCANNIIFRIGNYKARDNKWFNKTTTNANFIKNKIKENCRNPNLLYALANRKATSRKRHTQYKVGYFGIQAHHNSYWDWVRPTMGDQWDEITESVIFKTLGDLSLTRKTMSLERYKKSDQFRRDHKSTGDPDNLLLYTTYCFGVWNYATSKEMANYLKQNGIPTKKNYSKYRLLKLIETIP